MDFDIRKARRMCARSNKRKLTAQWSRHLAKMRKKLKKDAQDKKNKAALKALLDKIACGIVNDWAFAQCTEEIISHKSLFGSDSETDDEST